MSKPKFWANKPNIRTTTIEIGSNTLNEAVLAKIVGEGVPIIFIGTINATENPNYPAAKKGHQWLFTHAGKIGGSSGEEVEAGDKLVCIEDSVAGDHSTVGSKFSVVQGNVVDGVTSAQASTANAIARYSGETGRIVKNTGIIVDDDNNVAGVATIGTTGSRITKLWATDVEVTNNIEGSITGNAATATNLDGGNATTLLGSMPYQSDEDVTTLLAPNVTTTKKYIAMTGDATNGAAPVWSQVANSEIDWNLTDTYLPVMGASALADSTTTYDDGVFTFGSFPVTPSASPTTDYQVANKSYVDGLIYRDNMYAVKKAASETPRNSHDAEATTSAGGYELMKTITLPHGLLGEIRVKFDMKTSDAVEPSTARGKIYHNGVALGAEQTSISDEFETKTEDFTQDFAPGDTIELWGYISNTETITVQNFRLCYDDAPSVAVASVNS